MDIKDFIAIFIFLPAFLEAQQGTRCANGWIQHHDKCYFFSKVKEPWFAASALCVAYGARLAEPVTQEEVTFLSRETIQIGNGGDYYLGVTDAFLEGEWVYSSRKSPVLVHMPWVGGGPDNYHEEDCAAIDSSTTHHGQWTDVPCDLPLYFICEYSLDLLHSDIAL
ncbi:C-type lectin domain family 4 member E-like isoform X1 [Saccostrea cucullata]|uniref:C-type lectin domain family 4 member E-like isoform X1 n=1 Tax=Saccostrea cuccullata TaxID=36930 RepID=UPI002ED17109